MAWYDGIVSTANDIADVAKQVAGGVLDAGGAILKGAGTAISDPKKFASDVADNLGTWGEYIGRSAKSGSEMIAQGLDDAKRSGNPAMFFVKAVGGVAQISSLGAYTAIEEHVRDSVVAETDELGNVTDFSTKEGTDAITRVMVKMGGKTAANMANIDSEIQEALAEGDADKANEIFGHAAKQVGGKVLKTAALVGGVALAIPTGGVSLAAVAGGVTIGGGVYWAGSAIGNRMTEHGEVAFDKLNVEDDVADMRDKYVQEALASGCITEAEAEEYGKIVETVYQNATYKALDPTAIQAMGYENAQEMTSAMLQAYGYDTGNLSVIDMRTEDKALMYREQLQAYVDDGTYSERQADAFANLRAGYEDGQMDDYAYARGMAYVAVAETGLNEAEKGAYSDYAATFACGGCTQEQFLTAMANDQHIGKYVMEDGSVRFPEKQEAQAEPYAPEAAGAEQPRSSMFGAMAAGLTGSAAKPAASALGFVSKAAAAATEAAKETAKESPKASEGHIVEDTGNGRDGYSWSEPAVI